ncbi:MAG: transglutaminase domain-containing protein [Chloroflexota bacterium]
MKRRIPLAPAEGWLTLGCVLVMCLTMAWTLDDARWVLGSTQYLDFLVLAAGGGVLVGFIAPKVGWGRWLTYLIGAIFAALIVPLLVALVDNPAHPSFYSLYHATAASAVQAYIDIAINNLSSTTQYLHYILVLGMLVWATSLFASYAVFGHRRPISAVVVVGVILIGNMALTENNQLTFLVLYSLASLLLLVRTHVFEEQSEWLRRRIGDPTSISSVYMRGGAAFIAVTVLASYVLTQTAASAPLDGAWDGVKDGLIGFSQAVSKYLPTGGSSRGIGIAFGPNVRVEQLWKTDSSVAVTIQRNPTDTGVYYWRARTYDKFDLKGWGQSPESSVEIPADSSIFDQRADDVDHTGRHSFTFTVTPVEFGASTVLSPETPIGVDETVRLTTVGQSGYYSAIERSAATGAYTVTALTQVKGIGPGQLNVAALRQTETTYPDEIKALYAPPLPDGMMGPNALKLEAKILDDAPSKAPIDLAEQLVTELHSATYKYDTDIRDLPCASLSDTECFATYKRGFCQYYAATMAVILRDLGIPTRIAQGFLPGSREQSNGNERILFSNAHAWVEVWFPGYGWISFDPTGNDLSQLGTLPPGDPTASFSPRPIPSAGSPRPAATGRDPRAVPPVAGTFGGPSSLGPLVAVLALLLIVVGGVSFVVWQRGPRGGTTADDAYGTVTRIASRFGFGPRPAQTVYEYAGVLSDVLPAVRPELETVARAKVESVYAREIMGDERLENLKTAQRRLRVSLLRLAFRRKERRRRR